jgi:serine phosphatase RsbU (regulator of sigma subunit)
MSVSNFRSISLLLVIVVLLLLPQTLLGFTDGATFIKNYAEKDYNEHAQNFYITQDHRGIVFFANSNCVTIFDGVKWESVYMPNVEHVFTVAVNEQGKVFAAGENELGYLDYDQQGKLVYVSLRHLLSEQQLNFSDIFDIVCVGKFVYFLSAERLFIYDYKEIKSIEVPTDGTFRALFKVNQNVYVNENLYGLQQLTNGKLVAIKNAAQLGEIRVKSLFEIKGEVIALTGQNKFIKINSTDSKVLAWENIPAENNLIVRTSIKLKNGNICVGSKNDGLLIFDLKGQILAKYNTENGLIDNSIWYLYEDLQGNIWVATNKGISFIEMNSNIKKIKSEFLSSANLNSIVQHNGELYIATSQSLLKLKNNQQHITIEKVNNELETFHQILLFENTQQEKKLLTATEHGIFEIIGKELKPIDEDGDFSINKLALSRFDKHLLFASGIGKIYCYKYERQKWKRIGAYDIQGATAISFVEPNPGTVWAGTIRNEYFELINKPNSKEEYQISKLNLNLKKVNKTSARFFYLNGNISVDTDEGLYHYINQKWSKIENISGLPLDTNFQVFTTFESKNNKDWVLIVNDAGYKDYGSFSFNKNSNKLVWENKFLKRFYNIQINSICEINNELWLASNDGLFYFDLDFQKETGNYTFNTLINSIHVPNSKLFFQSRNWANKFLIPSIEYKNNQIRFEYKASNYVESEKIKFSSLLIPFDNEYSDWSFERIRAFTNLAEGNYTFKVKSMDIYGNIGKEDEFSFTILPPWYRTWWAYTSFALLAIMLTIGLIKFNTRRLKKQNQFLEATVINRTQEIEKQKNEIEEINREVTDSIKYAQMIQNSILPLASDLKKRVPQSFIFYKPRDIVSGDFYWIHEMPEENKIFVAAADCTGHGVPGAFMSMMGMEKLNQSVKVIHKLSPSSILSYLNKEIKLTLGKHINERELRDGMEIALTEIDLKNNSITFSGANRPMWVVSPNKSDDDIEVIKPTKAGIAGFTEFEQVFDQHVIQLLKGQTVYLFTDGAIDQFGGPVGKKIMTKGLKKLIIEIESLPLEEQHNQVANFFETWQGEHEQVDDILIIGLRLES